METMAHIILISPICAFVAVVLLRAYSFISKHEENLKRFDRVSFNIMFPMMIFLNICPSVFVVATFLYMLIAFIAQNV